MTSVVKKRGAILGVISCLLFVFLPSASHSQGESQEVVVLRKVAVLPFLIIRPETAGQRMVKGLWGESFFRGGDISSRAGSEVTTIFYRQLVERRRCEAIPLDRTAALRERVGLNDFRRDPLGGAAQIGRQLNVYAVVIGGVYRFEQRQGSAWGVEKPASVAFDAHLIRVEGKRVLWSGRFDETQRSLSEDLLKTSTFLKGGGRWVTVQKLTAIGVKSVLRTFPSLAF